MSEQNVSAEPAEALKQEDVTIDLKHFLEVVPPSVEKKVELKSTYKFVKTPDGPKPVAKYPAIQLFCRACEGERTFRASGKDTTIRTDPDDHMQYATYFCSNCHVTDKTFSLRYVGDGSSVIRAYKFGEYPPFGVRFPNRVLKLLDESDKDLLSKGRQCENLGYGIAAFSYYRRVVEDNKNRLFDEIIKVCNTLGDADGLIEDLEEAKQQVSFDGSISKIKKGLPQGLLIDGHNPLTALHSALSKGLHNKTDRECLEDAHDIRFVLSELVKRIASLKADDTELKQSMQRLMKK